MPQSAPSARNRQIGVLCLPRDGDRLGAELAHHEGAAARVAAALGARLGRSDGGGGARPARGAAWGTPRCPAPRGRARLARGRDQRHRLDGSRDPLHALAERRRGGAARLHDADLGRAAGVAGPGRAPDCQGPRRPGARRLRGRGTARGTGRRRPGARPGKLPGVLLALGAAVLFALGAVTARRSPLALPPLSAVARQVGLGCLPMVIAGLLFERPDPHALTGVG